ncbi:MAG: adenylosuccinate synthase [Myxococcales bacterium]|nr:adenylosuccinate synthase [Myxococcales bacterium]
MAVTAVVGAQWGDEGKGRVVDWLGQRADMVIRFQGGDNAGHTVINDYGLFKLHMVPSGIFNRDTVCIVGTGCVVNPDGLLKELAEVEAAGVSTDNLWLSTRAHVVLPYHIALDGMQEKKRASDQQIGTTKRGIGPAYTDKASRRGIRLGDLRRPTWLRQRVAQALTHANERLAAFDQPPFELEEVLALCEKWNRAIGHRIVDTMPLVRTAVRAKQNVLLEGQLGVMRDLDWGIYPYVTSSNPTAAYAAAGAGLPANEITRVIGVVKAYSTSVGGGPFPCELHDDVGQQLRDVGKEYGATTGRPRRCGWFDGVAISYAAWLNGFTGLAVTKLDVLDDFDEIKLCTAYKLDGEVLTQVPDTVDQERCEPIYETWPGWNEPTVDARRWDDLPKAARALLHRISELAGVQIDFISVGPERERLVVMDPAKEQDNS